MSSSTPGPVTPMPDYFDTRQIPDDPRHWDALAARIAARATDASRTDGFAWFAHSRASWVGASLLLAAALAFFVLPTTESSMMSERTTWVGALAPTDELGWAIAAPDAPPSIGALLLGDPNGPAR
jgi:hypothetical protein